MCIDEHKLLRDIERLLKTNLPKKDIDGFSPDPSIKASPIENGRQSRGARKPRPAGNNRSSDKNVWGARGAKSSADHNKKGRSR